MPRRALLLALAVLALAAVLPLPSASATVAGRSAWRADASQYAGATSDVGFYLDVGAKGRTRNAWLVEASLDLPPGWGNRYCARAEIRVNGRTTLRDGYRCDTNGDGRLEWSFGDLWLHRGDRVTAWFSDSVTRYALARPEVVA